MTLGKSLTSLGAGEEFPHRLVVRLKEVASEGVSGGSHVQRGGEISMSYRLYNMSQCPAIFNLDFK